MQPKIVLALWSKGRRPTKIVLALWSKGRRPTKIVLALWSKGRRPTKIVLALGSRRRRPPKIEMGPRGEQSSVIRCSGQGSGSGNFDGVDCEPNSPLPLRRPRLLLPVLPLHHRRPLRAHPGSSLPLRPMRLPVYLAVIPLECI